MSEFPFPLSNLLALVTSLVLLVLGAVIGAVIGIMADRKKYKYQSKSIAKTRLVESIYRTVGEFSTLEMALRNNRLNEAQWGQLRHFADLINQANSTVKALGIESKNLSKVQELITKMGSLSNKIKAFSSPSPRETIGTLIQKLTNMAEEGANLMSDAKNLADSLQTEFQKKKYLLF